MAPELRDSVLCPLCFSRFTRSQLDQPQVLTLDHVPPESLGGRDADVVLVCGQCNHTMGSVVDAHLLRTLRAANVASGVPGAEVDARLYPDDSESSYVSVTFERGEGGALALYVSRERSNPATADELFARLNAADESFRFTGRIDFLGGRAANSDVGLLRIGYLLLFRQFGYGALVQPAMNDVRHQIANPQGRVLPRTWSLPRHVANGLPTGISVINEPEVLRSLVAVFDLTLDTHTSRHAVLLPLAEPPGLSVYHTLEVRALPAGNNTLQGTHIPADPSFWTDTPQNISKLYVS